MPRVLFWNLNRKVLRDEVSYLAHRHDVDILILAEDNVSSLFRLSVLNAHSPTYFATSTACERISIYTTFSDRFISLRHESPYYTFREIHLPALLPFLLVAIHWKSLMWRSKESQTIALTEIGRIIREEEASCNHRRTIVVGDFNAEPFENGMVAANGLHAVMSHSVAARGQRTLSPFGSYPFFYNPMWSLYGDENDGPPGTYYRSSSEELCQFWHMFDQVLVRPELSPHLPRPSVKVVTEAGDTSLVNASGHPTLSDHLPLLFTFGLPVAVEIEYEQS
ncbi:MAG: endonuclease/exonuclease/phosphatase family protein [Cyanothece sp. SIO2G6]|nr:endonuclease/exonuclease/phosphatase family protein [Cyanothece sp. SIO2G6]